MHDSFGMLSQKDFSRLAKFISAYSGIKVPPAKKTMIEGRLRQLVRASGRTSFAEYCDYLFNEGAIQHESVHVIDAMTTNKTEFFREPAHFQALTQHIVPELVAGRQGPARSPLKIWSAACSIGAEPYTIAMVMSEVAQQIAGLRFEVFATDICTEVLQTARQGIYPAAMMGPVPTALQSRYVRRAKDSSRQVVRITPALRAAVQFGRLNLMEPPYPLTRDMDVIFCRNILIYFEKPTQLSVLLQLSDHLHPGGYLMLGHSESIVGFDLPLEPAGPNMFRRV